MEFLRAQDSLKTPLRFTFGEALVDSLGPSGLGLSMVYSNDSHSMVWVYNKGRSVLSRRTHCGNRTRAWVRGDRRAQGRDGRLRALGGFYSRNDQERTNLKRLTWQQWGLFVQLCSSLSPQPLVCQLQCSSLCCATQSFGCAST